MASRNTPAAAPQRVEEIGFQRAAVARIRREIGDVDRNSRRRYIREFHEEFADYEAPASWDELIIACYKADIIYVGDYHALPAAQEFAARLLDEVAERSRQVVLGLEMVYGRHQPVLDRYVGQDMEEAEFLKAIRYDLDWGYDWNAFRRLFEVARRRRLPTYGLDCGPRAEFRHIRRRDTYAAERLAQIVERHPGARTVVLFGESHLARAHLPRKVTDRLKRRGLEKRCLIVLQNQEEIYWRIQEQGQQGIDVVRLAPDAYCHFNASPIAKYEAYRRTIEIWKGETDQDGQVDLTSTVHGIIDMILRFLHLDKFATRVPARGRGSEPLVDLYPEVYSGLQVDDLKDLLRGARFSAAETEEVLAHVARNGSCYVPRINAVIIGQFVMVHAGEEAAHFVNLTLKGETYERAPRVLPQHDLFYTGVLEEALGFFGSKLVDPARNHFFETEFYQYYRKDPTTIEANTPYTYEEFTAIINFILLHKKFEQSYEEYREVPEELLAGIRAEPRRANILVHELGYFLGQQLHDAYRAGIVDRKEILALFRQSFKESGSALGTYLDLTRKVAPVVHGVLSPAGSD
ncbi:MAG TPA: ChaN family lipoprotein [Candidatus Cryosericum sp.]|nr:ChaN family lipoprotein [Candidatus Cryosericum sp.]